MRTHSLRRICDTLSLLVFKGSFALSDLSIFFKISTSSSLLGILLNPHLLNSKPFEKLRGTSCAPNRLCGVCSLPIDLVALT